MSLDPAIRRILCVRRVALGMSQSELAKRMGTQQSCISELENDCRDVRLGTLERWSEALGLRVRVSLDDVIHQRHPPAITYDQLGETE